MAIEDNAIQEFIASIKPQEYGTVNRSSAVVSHVDDEGVVWVNVAGSVIETPTASISSEVNAGDDVTVEWRNNKLFIVGNTSNPSAGGQRVDTVAQAALEAGRLATEASTSASIARAAADSAVADASRALEAAEQAETDASRAATAATNAEASASAAATAATAAQADAATAAQSAQSAQGSASSAGENASRAQAAAQAAQTAALATITTDTIHYLATSLGSGVTRQTAGWTTTVQTMTSTDKYLWTYHTYTSANGTTTDTDPIITGTYGEKGADGTSVTILGSYATLADLQAAHPTGTQGDAYMVSGDLYVWNGSAWENVGQIQGPQGAQGPQGPQGERGIQGVQGEKGDKGDKGDTGDAGAKGDKGDKGDTGEQGAKGDKGDTGATGATGPAGTDGDDGISVTSVQPQYYLSTSSSSATGGSWGNSLTYVVGKYIWTRDYITYSDNSHGTSTEIYNQALTQSCKDAADALNLVEEQQEYFWHDTLGAHILSDTDETGVRYRQDLKGSKTTFNVLNTDGTEDVVAEFGASGITIGIEGEAYLKMDTQSMKLVDSNENPYFQISNLKETQDREITEQHTGWNLQLLIDGVTYYAVGLNEYAESVVSVTVNGVSKSTPADYILYNDKIYGLSYICLVANPTSTGVTVVDYYIDTESLKAYTIGIRASGSDTGLFSFAEGYEVAAGGRYSHAQNIGTDAIGFAQTVIGRYNTTNYGALIIGNGNSDSERSNAFTVDWSGNVEIALNTSASSGSTDYALCQAITALGWQNDVID